MRGKADLRVLVGAEIDGKVWRIRISVVCCMREYDAMSV